MDSVKDGYLGFYWKDRAQTLGDHINFCSKLFNVLRSTVPKISEIALAAENGDVAVNIPVVGKDRYEVGRDIISPKVKYDYKENNSDITYATSPLGFTSTWVFSLGPEGKGSVTISSGSYGDISPGNSIVIKVNDWELLISKDKLEPLWVNVIAFCECDCAVFTSNDLNRKVDPEFQYEFSVGWLSYIAESKGLDENRLPVSIKTQEMGSGLIFKTSKDNLCSLDDELLHDLVSVQELMVNSGVIEVDDF